MYVVRQPLYLVIRHAVDSRVYPQISETQINKFDIMIIELIPSEVSIRSMKSNLLFGEITVGQGDSQEISYSQHTEDASTMMN
jgi:hypothetical protein